MESILTSLPTKPILGFPNSSSSVRFQFNAHIVTTLDFTYPSNLRSNEAIGLRGKQRLLLPIVFASNTNPSGGGDSPKKSSEELKTSDSVPQGPPLLTILAGFIVLFVVLWILGSIIGSLVGLIVNLSPFK